jgi:hypothetical protein
MKTRRVTGMINTYEVCEQGTHENRGTKKKKLMIYKI